LEQKIQIRRNGVVLNGMVFCPDISFPKPMVIIIHGLPSTPLPVEEKGYDVLGRQICSLGIAALIFNLSGCMGSTGVFSFTNWTKDLAAVLHFVRQLPSIDNSRLALLAFSAGTIPTIYHLAHLVQKGLQMPRLVILCACPANIAGRQLNELLLVFHLAHQEGIIRIDDNIDTSLLSELQEYTPLRWIQHITIPKYILHGAKDSLVNVQNAYLLFEKAIAPKELFILPNSSHKLRQDSAALKKIFEILKEI